MVLLTMKFTSGFWPRVRARALRAPVFFGSFTRQTGRCAPPPAHRSFLFDPQKYLQTNSGRLRKGFFLSTGAMKYKVP